MYTFILVLWRLRLCAVSQSTFIIRTAGPNHMSDWMSDWTENAGVSESPIGLAFGLCGLLAAGWLLAACLVSGV
jgi:hypothetical protein